MIRCEEAIRDLGGNQIRLMNTLMMFQARYSCYPTELHVSPSVLSTLVCYHFTPYGFYLLQQKIRIVDDDSKEFILIAKDENSRMINYNGDGWSHPTDIDDIEDLEEWLGFSFTPGS